MSSSPSPRDEELNGTEQPFVQHLIELRDRLLRSIYGILFVLIILFIYPGPDRIYDWLAKPLIDALPAGGHLIAIGVVSPFFVPIKVTSLFAIMISLPWILYQIWGFIAPGLYRHERKLIVPLIVSSTLLFYAGSAFSYFVVFSRAFPEIMRMAPSAVVVSPDIEAYLNFVMTMFLCFGLAFEVPVVLVVLVRMNLITIEKLKSFRGYYVVAAAIVSAIVTPPDPVSMLALMVPLIILFEVGLVAARIYSAYTKIPASDSTDLGHVTKNSEPKS